MSLLAKSIHGFKWTTFSTIVAATVGLIQLAILTRLLSKVDFGLFATSSVVMGLAMYFVEAGMGAAAIHRQSATREQLGSAYVINVILGWLVFLAVFSLSGLVASFYGEPRLIPLLQVSALVFLIQPLGMQYGALVQRDLLFGFIAKLDTGVALVGLGVSVLLALGGAGVYSFVYAQVVSVLIRTVVLLVFGVKKYGFCICFRREDAKYFFRFGAFQIGENLVNYINSQLDVLLVGKLLGQEALGVFFVAKQLVFRPMQLINPVVTRVTLPVFAKMQADLPRLKSSYVGLVHTLAIVHVITYFTLASFADLVVTAFFGHRWLEAIPLVQLMSVYVFFRAIGNPIGSLQVARGRVELGFYWNLALLLVIPPLVWLGSHWGMYGIAWMLVGIMVALQIPAWYFLVSPLCGATLREYFDSILRTIAAGVVCFGGGLFVKDIALRTLLYIAGVSVYFFVSRRVLLKLRGVASI